MLTAGLVAAIVLSATAAPAAPAVRGGALTLTIGGEVRVIGSYGDADAAAQDGAVTSGLDLFNDTEVDLTVAGRHEATGLDYGAYLALNADTNVVEGSTETWLYLTGDRWGALRFGDDDGVASLGAGIVAGEDGAALSAANVAAGTGGLDGDLLSDLFGAPTYEPLGTDTATKISYATPKFAGVNVAVSYTPSLAGIADGAGNGDALADRNEVAGDVVEGIVHYVGELGEVRVVASLAGLYGSIEDEEEAGGDDYWAAQAGVMIEASGLSLAGSYLTEKVGALDLDAVTLGVGGEVGGDGEEGAVSLSLNYGQVVAASDLASNDTELDRPYVLVVSADLGLLPGLVLQADAAYFDNDPASSPTDAGGDDGWLGVVALALEF